MLLGYVKITQRIRQKQHILGFKVNKTFWITFHTAKHYFSTILPVILQLFIKNGSHGWRASFIWTVNFKRLQEVEFHSIKVTLSSLRNFLETESPLKTPKNAFHLKCSSRSRDIWFFCLLFSVMSKNGLIRKTRLIPKFITPQTG